ncbi:hypothetical protein ISN44_As12g023740 [Arabidopsis suecica]|uniref:Uncharacterized protein n=1 Tax=Arabidopsis suecica TaxID=45249 RepID=A0A8T1YM59_ARASU|nr:hypothetical protein ISN44_As12g023740 [Arabidopsis suecica]
MWRLDLRSFKVPGSGKKAVRSRELYEFDVEDDDVDDDEEDIRGSEKKTRRDGYEVVYASGEKKRSKVDREADDQRYLCVCFLWKYVSSLLYLVCEQM